VPRYCWGFTLVELLVVVSLIAILGGVATLVVSNVAETNRVAKLEADVATINAAAQVFRASGGTVPQGVAVQTLLDEMKKRPTSADAARVVGFRGAVLDARLRAELQSMDEAATLAPRAIWNAAD